MILVTPTFACRKALNDSFDRTFSRANGKESSRCSLLNAIVAAGYWRARVLRLPGRTSTALPFPPDTTSRSYVSRKDIYSFLSTVSPSAADFWERRDQQDIACDFSLFFFFGRTCFAPDPATRYSQITRDATWVHAHFAPHSLSAVRYPCGIPYYHSLFRHHRPRGIDKFRHQNPLAMLTFVTGLEAWLQDTTRLGHEEIYGFVLYTVDQEEKRAITFAYVARGERSSFEATLKYKQLSDVPCLNSKTIAILRKTSGGTFLRGKGSKGNCRIFNLKRVVLIFAELSNFYYFSHFAYFIIDITVFLSRHVREVINLRDAEAREIR